MAFQFVKWPPAPPLINTHPKIKIKSLSLCKFLPQHQHTPQSICVGGWTGTSPWVVPSPVCTSTPVLELPLKSLHERSILRADENQCQSGLHAADNWWNQESARPRKDVRMEKAE